MRILALDKFYHSVPKDKEKKVQNKISILVNEFEQKKLNLEKVTLPNGFGFCRVAGSGKSIYKFRVDKGDRILCGKGEEIYPNIRNEYKDSLVLLEYCNHDSQIRIANDRSFDIQGFHEVLDPMILISENDNSEEQIIDLSLQNSTARIFDKSQIEELFGEESPFYYLDENQYACLHSFGKGQFVLGSAGSGKTTIGVYKLIEILRSNNNSDLQIAYFTFSKRLKDEAESLFHNIASKLYHLSEDYIDKVRFYTLEEYLEQLYENKYKLVSFTKFDEWYSHQTGKKFDSLSLWKERRGIIQGIIGTKWQYEMPLPTVEFDMELLRKLESVGYISLGENKQEFTLEVELNKICTLLQRDKSKPEAFRKKVIHLYNKIISSKKKLTEEEYVNLNSSYSSFSKEDREKIYTIFKKYDQYLERIKKQEFYEDGEVVRKALLNANSIYDFMVIDEIQDFTELQIYYFCQLLKQKSNVFVCGDFHQTINPTFFNVGRIESIFKFLGGIDNFERFTLKRNYRSGEEIVNLANSVAELRNKILVSKQDFEYTEESTRGSIRKPYLYKGKKEDLLKFVIDKSYVLIVVPNQKYKEELLRIEPKIESSVITVFEIKGIERKYIITYNMITAYKEQWQEIFQKSKLHSEIYRYYFNTLYVAITRARNILGMIEEDPSDRLLEELSNNLDIVYTFDADILELRETSSLDDLYSDARNHEMHENFSNAISRYKNLIEQNINNPSLIERANRGIKRCEIKKEFHSKRDYALCGNNLFAMGEYKEAIYYLQRAKDSEPYTLLKSILLSNARNQYNMDLEMKRYNSNPIQVLINANDADLLKLLLDQQIDGFKQNMTHLVKSSQEVASIMKNTEITKIRG